MANAIETARTLYAAKQRGWQVRLSATKNPANRVAANRCLDE